MSFIKWKYYLAIGSLTRTHIFIDVCHTRGLPAEMFTYSALLRKVPVIEKLAKKNFPPEIRHLNKYLVLYAMDMGYRTDYCIDWSATVRTHLIS
ncbi:hypothetical protein GDO86_002494 [Hymenochirus boettgeri]|uniref:Uncharacterized protein n=1 Tax=Hymenochirus boettgeri TaxID=247094 RepID=A0A8T2KMS9_9PIPI|nr:hypothetical protein GDO86_002494 [Hymenochirus boettgeri]